MLDELSAEAGDVDGDRGRRQSMRRSSLLVLGIYSLTMSLRLAAQVDGRRLYERRQVHSRAVTAENPIGARG